MSEARSAELQQVGPTTSAAASSATVGKSTLTQALPSDHEGEASTPRPGAALARTTVDSGNQGGAYDISALFGYRPTPTAASPMPRAASASSSTATAAPATAPKQQGMWERAFGQASTSVGKLGRVQAPKGVFLRERPLPESPSPSAPVPFNTLVFVERRSDQGTANERWCYVVATELGTVGFCEERYLAIDPPEPTAMLRRTVPGERLATIAENAYGRASDDDNSRLYVQALYIANRDRAGVQLDAVDLSRMDRAFRDEGEQRTVEIYKGVKVVAGTSLWIPSKTFVEQLKASGAVTHGSTVLTQSWGAAKGAVGGLVEGAKYVGGFFAGLLEGAYNAVVDLFKGAFDMVDAVLEVIWNIVTGNPGKVKEMASAWVDKMKAVWEHRGEIADEFLKKWNAEGALERGLFQGEVLGWVAMTVLLILATLGEGAPVALSGVTVRWPQLVKLLQTVDALGDVTTYLGAAVKAVKLPARAVAAVTKDAAKAEQAAARVAKSGAQAEELTQLSVVMANKGSRLVHTPRAQALHELLEEARRANVVLHSDEEAQRLLDWAARTADADPRSFHAVTIGDDIFVRPEYLENVRVLREELIHVFQQRAGISSAEIVEKEIEARLMMIRYRHRWGITADEIREMIQEVRVIRRTGKY